MGPKNFFEPNFNHTKPKVLLKENFCLIEENFCLIECHVVEKCFCIEEKQPYIDEIFFFLIRSDKAPKAISFMHSVFNPQEVP